jgi:hypothetical protein
MVARFFCLATVLKQSLHELGSVYILWQQMSAADCHPIFWLQSSIWQHKD